MFENIYGHEFAKNILFKSIKNGQLTNAYVFTGPEGVGKAKLAREFSKEIMGVRLDNTSDFIEINPKKDESTIKIEAIRSINNSINIKPYGKYKIYLINDADKMTVQAQNALLKTLEEPSSYGIIILITKNKDLLLETILSRCIELKFSPLSDDSIKHILTDNGYSEESISVASIFSRGNASLALEIANSSSLVEIREEVENFIEELLKREGYYEITRFSENIKKYSMQINSVIEIFELYIRDAILIKSNADKNLIANKYRYEFLNKLASALSVYQMGQIIDILEDSKKKLASNCNFNTCMQTMSLNIYEVVNIW
ncbi:ATP-binding protein [Peptostreptococcus equinus]|uniref:AAA family ATPase n=1 Tax=Peptostreptococcus equinus TaxID=3003601 RepID=A0ABY7JPC3_9FIRM|nr:AAA family ATPase [Peptostreptococcus sp. CBA3647]WAW15019.1 AAA family ATPase [Peptostreptococcus sp. CBA3647]